ncbi:SpaH/EbpB family LPXTG-anchored major pilin [Bifidobacterium simiarum]|uniref:SpaH/EbpB family LPXTG-anchored major pilin n=1 Tax=Bifidobacterium simiarum TaxID=2045441 RepID=UPI001BDD0D9A|nr:SpaH/EbpB family LPXTG-anchored major pilin [Bifidobacterium simiarum]MBT1165549.1 SpaH/EbpB family LPXTG-anchored major pilin [Bifidobacterium simiarum]
MKSLITKIAAVVLAAATALGMAGLGAATANAAGSGTITVNTVQGFAEDNGLKLYKMFGATVDTTKNPTETTYTLEQDWKAFFTSADANAAGTTFADDANLSANAVKHIKGLSDTELATFANTAKTWAEANKITATQTSDNKAKDTTFTFKNLDLGYYLIAPADSQSKNTVDQSYHALLVNLTDDQHNASIQLKHEFPTIDKTVENKPATDKNIGDTVSYKLSSIVAANMADYTEGYVFTFHDLLSEGLTVDTANFAPTVKIDGTVVPAADYTATAEEQANGKTKITVKFNDIQNKHPEAAGKEVTVEYSATLNEKADTGTAADKNKNSAQIEYSNDPSSNQTGTSVPSEVKVHTFEFTLDKYTGSIYNESSERLGGAKFKVYDSNKADATALKFNVTAGNGNNATTAQYNKDQTAAGLTDELVTPEYGRIVVSGLKAGTYWVEETEAPAGYNKLTEKIEVKITATYDVNGQGAVDATHTGKLTSWKITYNGTGDPAKDTDGTGEHPVVPVQNNSGFTLPSTGGMGTVAFTVVGVLIVAFGVVWAIRRKRA